MALFSSVAPLGPRRTSRLRRRQRLSRRLCGRDGGRGRWPVVSINWDTWREVGMAINTLRVAPGKAKPQALNFGLLTAEGVRAFKQALVAQPPQVIAPRRRRLRRRGGTNRPARQPLRCRRRLGAAAAAPVGGGASTADPSAPRARSGLSRARERTADGAGRLVDRFPADLADRARRQFLSSSAAIRCLRCSSCRRIRDKYQIALEPREFFANADHRQDRRTHRRQAADRNRGNGQVKTFREKQHEPPQSDLWTRKKTARKASGTAKNETSKTDSAGGAERAR